MFSMISAGKTKKKSNKMSAGVVLFTVVEL